MWAWVAKLCNTLDNYTVWSRLAAKQKQENSRFVDKNFKASCHFESTGFHATTTEAAGNVSGQQKFQKSATHQTVVLTLASECSSFSSFGLPGYAADIPSSHLQLPGQMKSYLLLKFLIKPGIERNTSIGVLENASSWFEDNLITSVMLWFLSKK